ncbi:MAG: CopD family protein [Anaerolineales bacterium]|nr:CopD family protein [Anaerolineales bacterium]
MPVWVLTLVYWLHLLATVVWIGSLVALALLVLPAARRTLDLPARAALLEGIQRPLESLGWFCLAILLATGMFQMSASQNYTGLISTANRWSTAILIKHLLFLTMVVISGVQAWAVLPALRRAVLRYRRSGEAGQLADLQRREAGLMHLNLILALLLLLATALARVS